MFVMKTPTFFCTAATTAAHISIESSCQGECNEPTTLPWMHQVRRFWRPTSLQRATPVERFSEVEGASNYYCIPPTHNWYTKTKGVYINCTTGIKPGLWGVLTLPQFWDETQIEGNLFTYKKDSYGHQTFSCNSSRAKLLQEKRTNVKLPVVAEH